MVQNALTAYNDAMITQLKNVLRDARDRHLLRQCNLAATPSFSLREFDTARLSDLLLAESAQEAWNKTKNALADLGIPESSGGVNTGDQRALFSIIHQLEPLRILEIGTHIGASTVHLATATASVGPSEGEAPITTVDIVDVNDTAIGQWEKFGAPRSPRENLKQLELEHLVKFEVSDSAEYLRKCSHKFDFIFLDGDHTSKTVFTELPLALSLLNPNGSILLHDYFPDNKPIWSDGGRISGPWLAVKKLQSQLDFNVLPLGQLPWPTKHNSSKTSLALVTAA